MKKSPKQLAKFLFYVLGRRPDEFGLVPDRDGFVKIKELLQAVNEEEGWRYVKYPLINELIITITSPPVEVVENRIRAVDRDDLWAIVPATDLPKLLFTSVTRKSYPDVLEKGIRPTRHDHVILSVDESMALRMGKRRDPHPVMLTVNVRQSVSKRVFFQQAGELLCLTGAVPVNCFTGPPLPKEKPEKRKPQETPETGKQHLAGSYIMDIEHKGQKDKKDAPDSWKRDKKRIRRQKQKKWPM